MAEYIERIKLLKELTKDRDDLHKMGITGMTLAAIKRAIRKTEEIPTADVRPERHGRWTDTSINLYDGSSERGYQCNVCKDIFFVEQSEIVYYKFCPHCGAKMDGKEREK